MNHTKKKGVTPVIAIIILLLIAVAISGAAFIYISSYYGGLTSKAIEVISVSCEVTNNQATITVRNIGTDPLATSDVAVTATEIGGSTATPDPALSATVNPGQLGTVIDDFRPGGAGPSGPFSGNTYRYSIVVAGRPTTTQVTC